MITDINNQMAPEMNSESQVLEASAGENINETTETSESVDLSMELTSTAMLIGRHAVLPNMAAEALALWAVHTYAFELRDITAYVGVESPLKRCGKSTLLMVLGKLVNRPVLASNISRSALFRVIEQTKPTLIIDEADTFLRGNEELRGILNAGYARQTAFVVRVANEKIRNPNSETRNKFQSEQITEISNLSPKVGRNSRRRTRTNASALARFSSWCPKVMAAIGHLPETLADRSIVIRMKRKTGHEICDRVRDLDGTALRRMCARFVQDHRGEISAAYPTMPKGLNDRACDIWEPLFALADIAGGEWPEKARKAAVELNNSVQEANPIGSLLLDIFVQFTVEEAEKLPSGSIVARLNTFEGRPWRDLCPSKEVDDKWLARQLRPYGVTPKLIRFADKVGRGYDRNELQEVCQRYISRADLDRLKDDVVQPEESVKAEPAKSRGESLAE